MFYHIPLLTNTPAMDYAGVQAWPAYVTQVCSGS